MNILDKARIKINPNIIDKWKSKKITDEAIDLAINLGYKYNSATVKKFMRNQKYISEFKNRDEVKNIRMENIKTLGTNALLLDENIVKDYPEEIEVICRTNKSFAHSLLISIKIDEKVAEKIIKNDVELLKVTLKGNSILANNDEFIDYVVNNFSPNLLEKFLTEEKLDAEKIISKYVKQNNPESIAELTEIISGIEFERYANIIEQNINSAKEPKEFVMYLERIKKAYNTRNASRPLQISEEYIIRCLTESPITAIELEKLEFLNNIDLQKYPEIIQPILANINKEKFEQIPKIYYKNKEIFSEIVKSNVGINIDFSYLIDKVEFFKKMNSQEMIDYCKQNNIPLSNELAEQILYHEEIPIIKKDDGNTVIEGKRKHFDVVIECLKNDYMVLKDNKRKISLNEYESLYNELKMTISANQIKKSGFLLRNPYFIGELISQGEDLANINFEKIDFLNEFLQYDNEDVFINLTKIEDIQKALKLMKKYSIKKDLKVCIEQNKFQEFIISDNLDYLKELEENGINIDFKYKTGDKKFNLKNVIEDENFLEMIANQINEKDFSPMEKLVAIYDITKRFKEYKKEPKEYGPESRALYEYMNNEYMVCAGYSNLLCNLGRRVGLNICQMSCTADPLELHSRNYINLKDSKYGIDGMYALDATWEGGNAFSYKHLLMTTKDSRKSINMQKSEGYDYLFTIKDPEEFRKMWGLLHKSTQDDYLEKFKILDTEFYKKFTETDIKTGDIDFIISYFDKKMDKEIDPNKILQAIINVKKETFKNFSEQDAKDLEMCSLNSICKKDGKTIRQYFLSRYKDIESLLPEEAIKENPFLNVSRVFDIQLKNELKDFHSPFNNIYNSIEIENQELLQVLLKNREKLAETNFRLKEKIEIDENDQPITEYFIEYIRNTKMENLSLKDMILARKQDTLQLLSTINLERKFSTEEIGRVTIEQQKDTRAKLQEENTQKSMEKLVETEINRQTQKNETVVSEGR